MDWEEDRAELAGHVDYLESLASEKGLSPDARVMAYAAMTNARAVLHASQLTTTFTEVARDDIVWPLVEALRRFGGQAEELSAMLGRLPGP